MVKIPRDVALFLNFGWSAALTLTGIILLGSWADRKLQWQPVCTIFSVLIGLAAVVWMFISTVKKLSRK